MKLIEIARKTIEAHFEGEIFECSEEDKKNYSDEKACFIVLTKGGKLRGCIGSLEPAGVPLWKEVQKNIIGSGFKDSRFPKLKKEELSAIKIEIYILKNIRRIEFENEKQLLEQLNNQFGVIIKKGIYEATFLPFVWEEFPSKRFFLEELSIKSGMNADGWKQQGVSVFVYEVDIEK